MSKSEPGGDAGLRLTVAQPLSVLGDVAANVDHHVELLSRVAALDRARPDKQADLVIFPELSLTGYSLSVPALSVDDPVLEPLLAACRASGCAALVGAPVVSPGGSGRQIATVLIDGSAPEVAYRKMWLGDKERTTYKPGSKPAVVEVGGCRLGLAICKDFGIAEHAVLTASSGIDVYATSVCDVPEDRPIQLERAERVGRDHRVWVAMASFAGPTGGGFDRTAGRSTIWRPDGTVAAELDDRPGQTATVTITA